jgi:flavin-dependent dehydrogenase
MYDAIIIGARCAGSPTAMLLARRGYRVLLVDKSMFPSDTISSHFIHPPGVRYLKEWDLLERVAATNCPPIHTDKADLGAFCLTGSPPPSGGVAEAYCVRRKYLDKVLVDAAVEAGAEVREGFSVEELLTNSGGVTGVRGRTRGGAVVSEGGRVVVGADGMHSLVARQIQATEYNVVEPLTCSYYGYWSGLNLAGPELSPRKGRFIVAAPTNDRLTIINVVAPRSDFALFRKDIERYFSRTLGQVPDLEQRVRQGKREERYMGTADTVNFFRQPFGPGWALVGDAGYHRDAITAQGISDAFRDAADLSQALDGWFSGRTDFNEAMAGYQSRRDESVHSMYEMTCSMARLADPHPGEQGLFEALRWNQSATNQFFGTIAGTVPVSHFYSKENLAKIMDNRSPWARAGSALA